MVRLGPLMQRSCTVRSLHEIGHQMILDGHTIHNTIDEKGYGSDNKKSLESLPSKTVLFTHRLVPVSACIGQIISFW
jgi:hypothetical protein